MTAARLPAPRIVGVGHDEHPLAEVRPAAFSRRFDARRNAVAHSLKVSDDVVETEGEMAEDVFEKAPFWPDLSDDAGDVRPEMAGVGGGFPEARE